MAEHLNAIPTMLALAVLVDRLGGEVKITQADIDKVAYSRLLEGWEGRALLLKTAPRPGASTTVS